MTKLSDAKIMGGLGSILVLLMPVPSVGWLLAIAGFILILVAIKRISESVGDSTIFGNMIYSVLLAIVALSVAVVTVIAAVLKILGMGSWVNSTFMLSPNLQPGDWIGLILAIIPGLIAVWVLLIFSAIFLRRSFVSMSEKLGVHLFDTGALIFLIGGITVVVGIGFFLILVAEIIFAVAFFSIPENVPASPQGGSPQNASK